MRFATVTVEPGDVSRFTDASGHFVVGALQPGVYRVRARQIGFAAGDTSVAVAARGQSGPLTIVLRHLAFRLPAVAVQAPFECRTPGLPDSTVAPSLAAVFGELRKNADRYRLLVEEYPFVYRLERWRVEQRAGGGERTLELDTTTHDSRGLRRYEPGAIIETRFEGGGSRRRQMYLPTLGDLADTLFQQAHCFTYAGADSATPWLVRIDFQPALSLNEADVEGSVYLDVRDYMVRRTVFRLTKPELAHPPIFGFTVVTRFREIEPGLIVYDEFQAVEPLTAAGDLKQVELDRLLSYRFAHGAPGDR